MKKEIRKAKSNGAMHYTWYFLFQCVEKQHSKKKCNSWKEFVSPINKTPYFVAWNWFKNLEERYSTKTNLMKTQDNHIIKEDKEIDNELNFRYAKKSAKAIIYFKAMT